MKALGFNVETSEVAFAVVENCRNGLVYLVNSGCFSADRRLGRKQYDLAQWAMTLLQRVNPDAVGCTLTPMPSSDSDPPALHQESLSAGAILSVCGFLPTCLIFPDEVRRRLVGDEHATTEELRQTLVRHFGQAERVSAVRWPGELSRGELFAAAAALIAASA